MSITVVKELRQNGEMLVSIDIDGKRVCLPVTEDLTDEAIDDRIARETAKITAARAAFDSITTGPVIESRLKPKPEPEPIKPPEPTPPSERDVWWGLYLTIQQAQQAVALGVIEASAVAELKKKVIDTFLPE